MMLEQWRPLIVFLSFLFLWSSSKRSSLIGGFHFEFLFYRNKHAIFSNVKYSRFFLVISNSQRAHQMFLPPPFTYKISLRFKNILSVVIDVWGQVIDLETLIMDLTQVGTQASVLKK